VWRWVGIILSLLSLSFNPGPDAAPTRIEMIGDSQMCGMSMFVQPLALAHDDVVKVDCKNGTRVEYWAAHQFSDETDVVVVALGTNNYHDVTTPNVAPILQSIQNIGASCIWIGPTAVHGKVWPVNALLRNAVSQQCRWVDLSHEPLVDGIHVRDFSALVHVVWSMITHSR